MRDYDNFAQFISGLDKFSTRKAVGIKRLFRTEHTTYHELQVGIYKTAGWLRRSGLKTGDRLLVVAPNMPEWCELFLASQYLGIVIVPADIRLSEEALNRILQRTQPKIVFRGRHFASSLDKHYETYKLEDLRNLVFDLPATPPTGSDLTGKETAVIMFTSGTTGKPKGVVLSQRNVLSNVSALTTMLPIQPHWRFLSILPFSHTYELTAGFLAPLSGGASIYYVARLAPVSIARALKLHQITSIITVPQMLNLFKKGIQDKAHAQGQARLLALLLKVASHSPFGMRRVLLRRVHSGLGGHLEFVATGGAPVDYDAARFWENLGVKVLQGYGLTETSPVLTINTLHDRNLHSQGKALPGVQIRLSDQGEVQVRGDNVFEGYYKDAEQTKAAFTSDGWFKTGDIAERDKDGWFYIKGRSKFMIVLQSGMKVMPEDIEPAANKMTALKEAVIVGVKATDGEEVYAVIHSEASDKDIEEALKELNQKLEGHQQISGWLRWDASDFPRSRLLKVDRRKVWEWANKQIRGENEPASSELEQPKDKIDEIIALVTNQPPQRIADSKTLADLGMDSLRRVTTVSLIEEQMSVSVAEHDIKSSTTVGELRTLAQTGRAVEDHGSRSRWTYWHWVRVVGSILREVIILPITHLVASVNIEGEGNLKRLNQPAIFIFNHCDNLDVPIIYRALPLSIRNKLAPATAQDVLKKHLSLSIISRLCFGAFDFARSEPFFPSLDYTAHLIENKWNILISPEGHITPDGKLQPFKSGTGMMAVEMQVQVIPIKVKNMYGTMPLHSKFPRKHSRVTVVIGEPIRFGKSTSYKLATEQLQKTMELL